MALITGRDMKISRDFPQSSDDRNGRLMVGAVVNVGETSKESVDVLVEAGVDVLVINSMRDFAGQIALIKWIKEQHPEVQVMAGNVVTVEQARLLIDAEADALQVRIESSGMFLL